MIVCSQKHREKHTDRELVSPLPRRGAVTPQPPNQLPYDEPIVLWRMRRTDGLLSHALLGPRRDGATVVWFLNDRPLGYRDFSDWTSALRWSEILQMQNWAVGWRLASD